MASATDLQPATGPSQAHVAVIGFGIAGAMAALALHRAGARVTVFEQFHAGHDLGASGGPSRMFRMLYHEGQHYVPLLLRSRRLWSHVEALAGQPLFLGGGALTIGQLDDPWLREMLVCAQNYDLPHEILTRDEALTRYPFHRIAPGDVALLDPCGGIVLVKETLRAIRDHLLHQGVQMVEGGPVTDLCTGAESITVMQGGKAEGFDRVLVATGPWLRRLLPTLPLRIVKVASSFHAVTAGAADSFRLPPTQWVSESRSVMACQPMPDGASVKFFLRGGFCPVEENAAEHCTVPFASGKRGDHSGAGPVPDSIPRDAEAALPQVLTGVEPRAQSAFAYYDGMTPDTIPLIGPVSSEPGLHVLAGYSLHGFKLAPALGEIAAAGVMGTGGDSLSQRFSPGRFMP